METNPLCDKSSQIKALIGTFEFKLPIIWPNPILKIEYKTSEMITFVIYEF